MELQKQKITEMHLACSDGFIDQSQRKDNIATFVVEKMGKGFAM